MSTCIKQLRRIASRGFGLVELLVAVGIMAVILTIVFANYGSFNSAVVLRSQAYEIALTIRTAQQRAVSVVGQGDEFRKSYGVYFEPAASAARYTVFRDIDDDGKYDPSDPLEFVEDDFLNRQFEIRHVKAMPNDVVLDDVSITFTRPNFDAKFNTDGSVTIPANTDSIVIGLSVLGSTGTGPDEYREIIVTSAGQIEVQ